VKLRDEEDGMDIKSINTEEDYRATLREIEALMTADPGTPEGEKLDVLVTLVEAYELEFFHSKDDLGPARSSRS
jgi:antitoxin component HigA of HigAB toxin-antitoxin module